VALALRMAIIEKATQEEDHVEAPGI